MLNYFFQIVLTKTTENIVCSPMGMALLLSAGIIGAEGRTKEELKYALHVETFDDSAILNGAINLINLYQVYLLRIINIFVHTLLIKYYVYVTEFFAYEYGIHGT